LGIVLLDPAQEAGDRRAVARLRRLVAGDLDRILDRLGQHHRVARIEDRRARRVERLVIAATDRSGSTATVLPDRLASGTARTHRARAAARHCRGARTSSPTFSPARTGRPCRRH
jgi:hypothetical protein